MQILHKIVSTLRGQQQCTENSLSGLWKVYRTKLYYTARMRKGNQITVAVLLLTVSACISSTDSCDDLAGTITHTVTEITGIESTSILRKNPNSDTLSAVDQSSGVEFSNLVIQIDLSWIEEEHRFRAPNTFIESMLGWFVSPVLACSLAPYYEAYQPTVTNIEIYSDSDISEALIAGSNLAPIFNINGITDESNTSINGFEENEFVSARSYLIEPAYTDGELVVIPTTPNRHIFTIMIMLNDGRALEIRTPVVQLSAV